MGLSFCLFQKGGVSVLLLFAVGSEKEIGTLFFFWIPTDFAWFSVWSLFPQFDSGIQISGFLAVTSAAISL